MIHHWKDRLVQENERVFLQTFWAARFATGYQQCGDGWREIVSMLVQRIIQASSSVQFTEIRERHGVLLVNWKSVEQMPVKVEVGVEWAAALATARSTCACSRCGSEGRLFSDGVRLATACGSHRKGEQVPVVWGFHDVYLSRKLADVLRLIRCRYDRGTDAFIEITQRADGAAAELAGFAGARTLH